MIIPARYAYAAAFVGVCGHASSEFVAKVSGVGGPEASVWRYVIGGVGLAIWALISLGPTALWRPVREGGAYFWLVSLIGVSATYLAFHWALDFASIVQVATVVTTIPIFVALANWLINGQPPSNAKIVTGVAATFGVLLLITDGALDQLGGSGNSLYGVLLATFCAAAGSFYSVLVKPIIGKHGALPTTAASLCIGALGLWLAVGVFWSIWVNPAKLFDRPAAEGWWLLTLGLWNTTITQLLWFGGLAAAPDITRASYLFFLKPVIAAALALAFVAGATLSVLEAAAIVVVTGSVFIEIFWDRIVGRRKASARG
ncbi:MAG: DMT family transporter [Neomegalonema sp.]|nr:DMT family transporter [Neomegalonema sp.]